MRIAVGVTGAVLVVACAAGAGWAARRGEQPAALRSNGTPVIVELFSSEGCSSCPPADEWLASVDRRQPVEGVSVIALEEHVDYWDRLGWSDPFAQPLFGQRQGAYAHVLADRRVYTPEVVIDGRAAVQNGDEDQAAREMATSASEPRAPVSLARQGDRVAVDVTDIPDAGDDVAQVWLAVTESGLASDVTRGENSGHRLVHAPIVRALRELGVAQGRAFHAETAVDSSLGWAPRALRVVAFVQLARTRHIVGANAL